ncbi:hypothetical protein ACOME3_009974 [Neoechinorhynchus agilis]
MPIDSQKVSPRRIAAFESTVDDADELAFISNFTLCNLIRQLSTINRRTSELMREVTVKMNRIEDRHYRLRERLLISERWISESQVDVVKNQNELFLRDPCRTGDDADDDESPLASAYQRIALPAPPLYMLNKFRTDNKDSSSFYSDPSVFYANRRVTSNAALSINASDSRPPSVRQNLRIIPPEHITQSITNSIYGETSLKSSRSCFMQKQFNKSLPSIEQRERPMSIGPTNDRKQDADSSRRSDTPQPPVPYFGGTGDFDNDFPPPPQCDDFPPEMCEPDFQPPNIQSELQQIGHSQEPRKLHNNATSATCRSDGNISATARYGACASVSSDLMAEIRRGFTLRKVKNENSHPAPMTKNVERNDVRFLMAEALKHRRRLVNLELSFDSSSSANKDNNESTVTDL